MVTDKFFFPFYLNNDSLCAYLFIFFLCDTVAASSRTRAFKDYEGFSAKFAAYNCFPCVLVGNHNYFRPFYVTVRTTHALFTQKHLITLLFN